MNFLKLPRIDFVGACVWACAASETSNIKPHSSIDYKYIEYYDPYASPDAVDADAAERGVR